MCSSEEKHEKRLFKHICPDFVPTIYGAGAWLALRQLASSLNDTSKHSSMGERYDWIGVWLSVLHAAASLNGTSKHSSRGERYDGTGALFWLADGAWLSITLAVSLEGLETTSVPAVTRRVVSPRTSNTTADNRIVRMFNMIFCLTGSNMDHGRSPV